MLEIRTSSSRLTTSPVDIRTTSPCCTTRSAITIPTSSTSRFCPRSVTTRNLPNPIRTLVRIWFQLVRSIIAMDANRIFKKTPRKTFRMVRRKLLRKRLRPSR
uniref:(northern house mosquito) hypothetical protein n=1 Tax=Culex pipiens TaxID=7175 RepID=A0A8D8FED4_CULPI